MRSMSAKAAVSGVMPTATITASHFKLSCLRSSYWGLAFGVENGRALLQLDSLHPVFPAELPDAPGVVQRDALDQGLLDLPRVRRHVPS